MFFILCVFSFAIKKDIITFSLPYITYYLVVYSDGALGLADGFSVSVMMLQCEIPSHSVHIAFFEKILAFLKTTNCHCFEFILNQNQPDRKANQKSFHSFFLLCCRFRSRYKYTQQWHALMSSKPKLCHITME